jgi:iron complex transport system ATP-binding protein
MSSDRAPALELLGVSVAYGDRRALVDIDLRLSAGERVCLIGPNGAGKSTLVRCLTGLVTPTAGSVRIGGRPLASVARGELARSVAVVPGSARLPFAMTVTEVVALGRTPHLRGWSGPSPADTAAVIAALGRADILDLRHRDVRTLSMGERQLTLIAMALAQGGNTLILDEPTVHLDLRHQVTVMQLLERLSTEEGMTILAVLHDLSLARHSFPRLAMLDHGRLVADGPEDDVLTPDRIRSVYGVEPRYVTGLGSVTAAV